MSITIVATVGASDANSFVTEAEQVAYMATRLNASAWTTVSGTTCTEDEKKAMIEATRELSSKSWCGQRVTDTQSLSWPRQWAINPDSAVGNSFGVDVIPQAVKDATCELAFQFVNAGTTDIASADTTSNIRRTKVDVLETEYFDPYQRTTGLARFPRVLAYIQPLLASSGSSVEVIRG